ncbi:hypothetical protein NMG60_11008520 [Bertholletia excelsa]
MICFLCALLSWSRSISTQQAQTFSFSRFPPAIKAFMGLLKGYRFPRAHHLLFSKQILEILVLGARSPSRFP